MTRAGTFDERLIRRRLGVAGRCIEKAACLRFDHPLDPPPQRFVSGTRLVQIRRSLLRGPLLQGRKEDRFELRRVSS